MAGSNIDKLLDPNGDALKEIAKGRRGAGRLEVTAMWPQIERALDAGATVTMVWEALSKQGLLSIKLRGFTQAVKGRREGASGRGARPKASSGPGAAGREPVGERLGDAVAPAVVAAEPVRRPGIPERSWRQGPHVAPDATAVFKPRDPLAED